MFIMEHFQGGRLGDVANPRAARHSRSGSPSTAGSYVSKAKVDVDKLMSLLKSQIVSGNIQGAISTCQASPSPVTRIIAAGLRRAGGSEHDVQQAMDEEALRELPKIEKRTGYLAMLGNLATLAGLLGTITRPHQVVRRRRRCRPVDEGDDALEGHLGGDELHRLRPRDRYLRPRRPTPSSTA